MPSNNDLKQEIGTLAETLGLEISTDGLNNKQLAELASDLKAKKRDAETETQADQAAPVPAQIVDDAPACVIAKGKALTSLKGILAEGTPVTPQCFHGGLETFERLKEKGFII